MWPWLAASQLNIEEADFSKASTLVSVSEWVGGCCKCRLFLAGLHAPLLFPTTPIHELYEHYDDEKDVCEQLCSFIPLYRDGDVVLNSGLGPE